MCLLSLAYVIPIQVPPSQFVNSAQRFSLYISQAISNQRASRDHRKPLAGTLGREKALLHGNSKVNGRKKIKKLKNLLYT